MVWQHVAWALWPGRGSALRSPSLSHRFYITVGIESVPERSGSHVNPLSLFLFSCHFLSHSHTHTHTDFHPLRPPSWAFAFHTAAGQKKLIYKSSLLGEEIQAAAELTPRSCLYPGDVSLPVFLRRAKPFGLRRTPAVEELSAVGEIFMIITQPPSPPYFPNPISIFAFSSWRRFDFLLTIPVSWCHCSQPSLPGVGTTHTHHHTDTNTKAKSQKSTQKQNK